MKLIRNKYYLYATGFLSGMSVMAIEMGASRLLTPYFSSSQIVWTVIIGTIMIAMAAGNVWGGRSADKNPDPGRLYGRLLIAAIWTALIPIVGRYVILAVTFVVIKIASSNYLIRAALLSCAVLFVFPLMLLGTVTPSLIKYATKSLEDNGKVVGILEACGTIGSILGTFLPTFVTIPSLGTAISFYIFAAALSVLSLLYFLSVKKHVVRGVIASGILITLIFLPFRYRFAFWENNTVYEGESIYNYLRVDENDARVILSTNVLEGVQSIYVKGGGLTGMYYDYALAAPLMTEEPQKEMDLLILGMGTGTYAKQCRAYFPNIRSEGVEIDRKIVNLSHEYFDLPEDIPVTVEDGRAYLRNAGKYDIIMVDAYQDITIPFQMSSKEFFEMIREHLNEGGVLVLNMNMKQDMEGGINDYIEDTVAAVFPEVLVAPTLNNTNIELFAGEKGIRGLFEKNLAAFSENDPLKKQMETVGELLEDVEGGPLILTDDKAPVEKLGMRALDAIIQDTLDEMGGNFDFF